MKSPALKAGLIGAVIVLVLNLIGIIPVIGCIGLPLELVAYVVIGALAALWMTPRREAGRAAGQGALAGLIAGAVSGVVARSSRQYPCNCRAEQRLFSARCRLSRSRRSSKPALIRT